jgi:hypothetical protein
MARFIDSDYVEISGPHKSDIRRELVNVYRGRFCFKLGAGVRCGAETKFTIGSGEKRKLELSFGAGIPVPGAPGFGASGGIEYEHTFAQEIGPWPLDTCDSLFPVICFEDAEVKRFRTRRLIHKYALSAYTERFIPKPDDYGSAYPNKLPNDPACDCHDPDKSSTIEQAKTETVETPPELTVLRSLAFLGADGARSQVEDAAAAAEEAAVVIGNMLEDDEGSNRASDSRRGIVRADGYIVWLDQSDDAGAPSLVLLPWGIASMGHGINTVDKELTPLIAVAARDDATACDFRIFASLPGEAALSLIRRETVPLQTGGDIQAAWCDMDFAEMAPETTGYVELELLNSDGQTVGYPAREPFVVDPLAMALQDTYV